jgi:holliday junction DNA helicase RuvA
MIAGLRGRLAHKGPDHLLVDIGPMVMHVFAPATTLEKYSEYGQEVQLHTHLYVREDQLTLYGFSSQQELKFFQLVTSVSGIGPRAALTMLSTSTVDSLQSAIVREDAAFLSKVPGIGKKTAARIILELKNKVEAPVLAGQAAARLTPGLDEVGEALRSMGYSPREVQAGLAALPVDEPVSVEQALMIALRHLGTRQG